MPETFQRQPRGTYAQQVAAARQAQAQQLASAIAMQQAQADAAQFSPAYAMPAPPSAYGPGGATFDPLASLVSPGDQAAPSPAGVNYVAPRPPAINPQSYVGRAAGAVGDAFSWAGQKIGAGIDVAAQDLKNRIAAARMRPGIADLWSTSTEDVARQNAVAQAVKAHGLVALGADVGGQSVLDGSTPTPGAAAAPVVPPPAQTQIRAPIVVPAGSGVENPGGPIRNAGVQVIQPSPPAPGPAAPQATTVPTESEASDILALRDANAPNRESGNQPAPPSEPTAAATGSKGQRFALPTEGANWSDLLRFGLATMAAASKPGATTAGAIGEGGLAAMESYERRRGQNAGLALKAAELNLHERMADTQDKLRDAQVKYYDDMGKYHLESLGVQRRGQDLTFKAQMAHWAQQEGIKNEDRALREYQIKATIQQQQDNLVEKALEAAGKDQLGNALDPQKAAANRAEILANNPLSTPGRLARAQQMDAQWKGMVADPNSRFNDGSLTVTQQKELRDQFLTRRNAIFNGHPFAQAFQFGA